MKLFPLLLLTAIVAGLNGSPIISDNSLSNAAADESFLSRRILMADDEDNKDDGIDDDLKSDEETAQDDDDDDDDDDSDESDEKKGEDNDDPDVKSQAEHKLLIILLGGFRHDYVKRDSALKGFARMAKQGVVAKSIKPVHPATTYSNAMSIATGLYPESHEFISDYIRDKQTKQLFLGSPHSNVSHWWAHATPLWTQAQRHRIKVAMYNWDGCQVIFNDRKKRPPVSICEPYKSYSGKAEKEIFEARLNKVVADFKEHKYRLAMIYYEGVDYIGHRFGPQSRTTKQAVRDVDDALYDLQDQLVKNDLDDEVNVYVVSDHGMMSSKKIIDIELEEYIDMNDVELILGEGAAVQILAEKGKHSEVFSTIRRANIKGLNVYQKSTIPDRLHIKRSRNLLPIYLTADKGFFIDTPDINKKVYPDTDEDDVDDETLPKGIDGYDGDFISEMKGIMYAFGSDIQDNRVIDEISQVDHYNVFCELLELKPRANNGSATLAKKLLSKFEKDDDDDDDSEEDDDKDDDSKERPPKIDKDDDDDNAAAGLRLQWPVLLSAIGVGIRLHF